MNKNLLPRLVTERLILRPFSSIDGAVVERLAGARDVADTTLTIPHPYPEGGGTEWILTHAETWQRERGLTLAICTGDDVVIGAISLQFSLLHSHGELGYWIGVDHWGQGYATEAAQAMVSVAFTTVASPRSGTTFHPQSGVGTRAVKARNAT